MAFGSQRAALRIVAGLISLALMTLALPQPAAAGFFERIFNGLHRAVEAPQPPLSTTAFVDPFTSLINHFNPRQQERRAGAGGPARAFCVRTCDGHYFPVQAQAGMSAAESCHAFCPASETRLYAGSNIDYATTSDGSRYADLPNAFAYRRQLVAGCTCNGRNAFGLAHISADRDPTLRPGDVVVTKSGLVAVASIKNSVAEFTPVKNYSGFTKSTRELLSETRIMPTATSAADLTSSIPSVNNNVRDADAGRAQPR